MNKQRGRSKKREKKWEAIMLV